MRKRRRNWSGCGRSKKTFKYNFNFWLVMDVMAENIRKPKQYSMLPSACFVFSGLSLIVALLLCAGLWPGALADTMDYVPSLIWLTAGLAQCLVFAALGQGLHYLKAIAESR